MRSLVCIFNRQAIALIRYEHRFFFLFSFAYSFSGGIEVALPPNELSPLEFGAKGDAVTDDTDALQKAIDAAHRLHKVLNLGSKSYRTTRTLYCYPEAGETFRLIGKKAVLIIQSNGLESDASRTVKGLCGTVVLSGITFQAPSFGTHYDTQLYIKAVFLKDLQRAEIRHCRFLNIYGNGIHLYHDCASGIIDSNSFEGVGGKTSVLFQNVTDNYGDGICLENNIRQVVVSGNRITLESGTLARCGISVDYNSRDIRIERNQITGYDRSIHVETSKGVQVTGNTIRKSACGIYVAYCDGVNVIGNSVDGSSPVYRPRIGAPGLLYVFNSNNIKLTNNRVLGWTPFDVPTYAVKLWGNNLLFQQNEVEKGPVFAYGGFNGNQVIGNKFGSGKVDFSRNTQLIVRKNQFLTAPLILSETVSSSVTDNDFLPARDSLYAGGVDISFVQDLDFTGNRISSVKEFALNNYRTKSFSVSNNSLTRRKRADTDTFLRFEPNSPAEKKPASNQLKDLVTNQSRSF